MAELTNEQLADKKEVAGKLKTAITLKSSLSPLFLAGKEISFGLEAHVDYNAPKN